MSQPIEYADVLKAAGANIDPAEVTAQMVGNFNAGGAANMMKWDFNKMAERLGNDERCLGPGLAAYFVKGALDRDIPMWTGAAAEELIADGERVVGVRVKRGGRDLFVKANNGVVVAVSSYERRQDYNKTLGTQLDLFHMEEGAPGMVFCADCSAPLAFST